MVYRGNMKAQSAMEYLMTYGWAILIIAIVLVALFSLGVFNSSNFSPRAQPGSCEVLRNSAQTSLVGQCNGMLPEYVATFSNVSTIQNITIKNMPAIAPSTGDSFTITLWIKPVSTANFGGVAIWSYYFQIGWSTDFSPNGVNWLQSNILAPGGTWSFLTVEETVGKSASIYLNGVLTGNTTNYVSYVQPVQPVLIGSVRTDRYLGSISNVQIYNTSLSNSSIQALYKEGIGGAPININNLIGWWPLNGNANDYSGNGNNGVPTNVTYTSAWTSGYSAP